MLTPKPLSLFDINRYLTFEEMLQKVKEEPKLRENWREYTLIELKDGSTLTWKEYIEKFDKVHKQFRQFLFDSTKF